MKTPLVSIIIVNFKSYDFTVRAVASLEKSTYANREIIVVDNNSGQEEVIKLQHMPQIRLIASHKNVGFGAGCNLGAQIAGGEYLLFMNPDVQVQPDSLESLITEAEKVPNLGAIGCKVLFDDKSLQPSAHKGFPNIISHTYEYTPLLLDLVARFKPLYYPSLYKPMEYKKELLPKSLLGAFMLIPRLHFDKVNGFDETFFLYREETDLCNTLLKHNYVIKYVPKPIVTHTSGASTRNRYYANLDPRYMRSAYWYLLKQHGAIYALLCWTGAVIGLSLSLLGTMFGYTIRKMAGKQGRSTRNLIGTISSALRWHFKMVFKLNSTHLAYRSSEESSS